LLEAKRTEKAADRLLIREGRLEGIVVVLELWRQADATPGVTDTADDLRRVIRDCPAVVLIAEVEGRLVGSIIGTFDGWRGSIYRLAVHPGCRRSEPGASSTKRKPAASPSSTPRTTRCAWTARGRKV